MTTAEQHNLVMTRMLFTDAIFGVGVTPEVTDYALKAGLVRFAGNQHNERWEWTREALEDLSTATLQDLYTSLKLHEVSHAH